MLWQLFVAFFLVHDNIRVPLLLLKLYVFLCDKVDTLEMFPLFILQQHLSHSCELLQK